MDGTSYERERILVAYNSVKQLIARPVRRALGRDNRLTARFVEAKYDALAGRYVHTAKDTSTERYCRTPTGIEKRTDAAYFEERAKHYASILNGYQPASLLEVGAGELTTLATVAKHLGPSPNPTLFALDLSLNRIAHGLRHAARERVSIQACVGDAARLPFPDQSMDVVFTSHCLEHMPYDYKRAVDEALRVARRAVVFFEPWYEGAEPLQKLRMRAQGYARGLGTYLRSKRLSLRTPRWVEISSPYNRTAVFEVVLDGAGPDFQGYVCPKTGEPLRGDANGCLIAPSGTVYFKYGNVPILNPKYAMTVTSTTDER